MDDTDDTARFGAGSAPGMTRRRLLRDAGILGGVLAVGGSLGAPARSPRQAPRPPSPQLP